MQNIVWRKENFHNNMMMEIEKDNQVGESVSSFVQSENFWEEMTAMHSEVMFTAIA